VVVEADDEGATMRSKHRIQRHGELKEVMKSVAQGARHPPADAAAPSFNSVGALLRLLAPEKSRRKLPTTAMLGAAASSWLRPTAVNSRGPTGWSWKIGERDERKGFIRSSVMDPRYKFRGVGLCGQGGWLDVN
jgi:hypothetical protein